MDKFERKKPFKIFNIVRRYCDKILMDTLHFTIYFLFFIYSFVSAYSIYVLVIKKPELDDF